MLEEAQELDTSVDPSQDDYEAIAAAYQKTITECQELEVKLRAIESYALNKCQECDQLRLLLGHSQARVKELLESIYEIKGDS